MARKQPGKPIMASEIPSYTKEPSYQHMYKGCSIYSYKDNMGALRLVMFDNDHSVRHGTKDALQRLTMENMDKTYNLELVREIDG